MKTMYFKTDIADEHDKSALREQFSKETRIYEWHLDLSHPERLLEVYSDELEPEDIEVLVQEAGFRAWSTASPEKQ